jgi:hypothetical protein
MFGVSGLAIERSRICSLIAEIESGLLRAIAADLRGGHRERRLRAADEDVAREGEVAGAPHTAPSIVAITGIGRYWIFRIETRSASTGAGSAPGGVTIGF